MRDALLRIKGDHNQSQISATVGLAAAGQRVYCREDYTR